MMPYGVVDGITTNPTLIAKQKQPWRTLVEQICDVVKGPVSVEVVATTFEEMLKEAMLIAEISPHCVVKLPLTVDGLRVCRTLSDKDIATNVTLCFSPLQALLAAKAGATYVSPFVGRLDDIGHAGLDLIRDIRELFDVHSLWNTHILAASLRHSQHVMGAAQRGANAVTIAPALLQSLYQHPLTDAGLKQFLADWATTGQSIS